MLAEAVTPPLSILLVSPEFPPMPGGVGRYTYNLKKSLTDLGFNVQVVCDERGKGEFSGISQYNQNNSETILELVDRINPDLVHVQYEPGMYGLHLDILNPAKTSTNIDSFYKLCRVPIVTTFHSAYPFKQWMNLSIPIYERYQDPRLVKKAKCVFSFWARLLNYRSFHKLNTQKLEQSAAGIVFSEFMSSKLGGRGDRCHVIYHGGGDELISTSGTSKGELRKAFSMPEKGRIALALGYATPTKGWDLIEKMDVPDNWTIVINASKNEYSSEKIHINTNKANLIDLHQDFLNEGQLCALFSLADAIIMPYTVSSGSGILFDGLSYGLPFIATKLGFFEEFSSLGLGITVKRTASEFSKALLKLERDYDKYSEKIKELQKEISWQEVAKRHASLYHHVLSRKQQAIVV